MHHTSPARAKARPAPPLVLVGLAVVVAAIIGTVGYQSTSSSAPSSGEVSGNEQGGTTTENDGGLPDGATVFDEEYPGVANLAPALLGALQRAATDAAGAGVVFSIESGWRSPAYQQQLLREAIATYGSEKEAARWVATPDKSAHVSGKAVDIGPSAAITWLSRQGAKYGLCQIYGNEPWHYELRPNAVSRGCPSMYADPTQDPRMQ